MNLPAISYKRHRFPPQIIAHAVWLYFRFPLSLRLIEEMLLDPAAHKWVCVSNQDIGEPGCKSWHVRPRLGPIGMLMGWWRVVISSGCPLAT